MPFGSVALKTNYFFSLGGSVGFLKFKSTKNQKPALPANADFLAGGYMHVLLP